MIWFRKTLNFKMHFIPWDGMGTLQPKVLVSSGPRGFHLKIESKSLKSGKNATTNYVALHQDSKSKNMKRINEMANFIFGSLQDNKKTFSLSIPLTRFIVYFHSFRAGLMAILRRELVDQRWLDFWPNSSFHGYVCMLGTLHRSCASGIFYCSKEARVQKVPENGQYVCAWTPKRIG